MDTSFNSKVKMRNDEVVEVKGKDSIGIETKKRRKRTHDVLFVLELD